MRQTVKTLDIVGVNAMGDEKQALARISHFRDVVREITATVP